MGLIFLSVLVDLGQWWLYIFWSACRLILETGMIMSMDLKAHNQFLKIRLCKYFHSKPLKTKDCQLMLQHRLVFCCVAKMYQHRQTLPCDNCWQMQISCHAEEFPFFNAIIGTVFNREEAQALTKMTGSFPPYSFIAPYPLFTFRSVCTEMMFSEN